MQEGNLLREAAKEFRCTASAISIVVKRFKEDPLFFKKVIAKRAVKEERKQAIVRTVNLMNN